MEFHAFVGNSQICHSEVLWTTQNTIALGYKAEGDSASGRPWHQVAIDLTFAHRRDEIVVILPNKCENMNHYARKLPLCLTLCSSNILPAAFALCLNV